ncbi:hypothetical protein N7509_012847 [Penicillium cosmopolitanum]|uniref:Uncharacterized protein n=1 Tax=Penicillium cosmopolitanum TaxID=1131564 RepID=A0A9W9SC58_9EURO|nr:uncharacterized protein N7509_012847 [Penicillium cosmopolitanum]KAJ5375961.1 hypothetical protein N7509_012847 [Penicillium cosmopolitanum]
MVKKGPEIWPGPSGMQETRRLAWSRQDTGKPDVLIWAGGLECGSFADRADRPPCERNGRWTAQTRRRWMGDGRSSTYA